jgi:hypothetical protein
MENSNDLRYFEGEPVTWNYRLLKRKYTVKVFDEITNEISLADGGCGFFVAEVYYDENLKPKYWCEASSPTGDTEAEARRDLAAIGRAFDKPVLLLADDDTLSEEAVSDGGGE